VVEFGIGVGDYEGTVRVPGACSKSCFRRPPRPNAAWKPNHLHRTRLEPIAERKVRRKQLTDDGNVEITGRDLWEREVQRGYSHRMDYRRVAQ
jgi:hypothetical protein